MLTLDQVRQRIASLVASFKAKALDGMTPLEIWAFIQDLIAALMTLVSSFDGTGADKKTLVMQAVSEVLDYVVTLLAFPGLPWWLRLTLSYAMPAIKAFLLQQAELWLENQYLAKFKPATP